MFFSEQVSQESVRRTAGQSQIPGQRLLWREGNAYYLNAN